MPSRRIAPASLAPPAPPITGSVRLRPSPEVRATLLALKATGAGLNEALGLAAQVHAEADIRPLIEAKLAGFRNQGGVDFLEEIAKSSPELAMRIFRNWGASVRVVKDLCLSFQDWLTDLPQGIVVGRDLNLNHNANLCSLPDGLVVGGDLTLSSCTALESLPSGLSVGRNLWLGGCHALRTIPEDLKVGGDLQMASCAKVPALPSGLTVARATLIGCGALRSLPERFSAKVLLLDGCAHLGRLPHDLVVTQALSLDSACPLFYLSDEAIRALVPGVTGHIHRT